MVFETLGQVTNLSTTKTDKDEIRLHGVFGVCGIRNQNNRIYDKTNYSKMVESLQKVIATEGCLGELEHPNSMNINLENVSHKIESIEMNEDGTIVGTILLLNTPKGKIAKAIVESGVPLYISSRGAGTITNEGKVTLSNIKTYDLVGTPGFSQAKLTLKENQQLECLNENLDEGNVSWVIYENDDKDDDKKDTKKDDKADNKDDENLLGDENSSDNKSDENEPENKNDNDISMNDLKVAIDKLTERISSLESQLHVAQESLDNIYDDILTDVNESIRNSNEIMCESVQKWVVNEFAPEVQNWIVEEYTPEYNTSNDEDIKEWVKESVLPGIQSWVVEEFAPEVQNWIIEEFAPEVQNWIIEEYSPEVQNWIIEEYSPEAQNCVVEECSDLLQNWIVEEYSSKLGEWINEEVKEDLETKLNENVSKFIEENNSARLNEIDSLLESIDTKTDVERIVAEEKENNKYKGVYCVEHMPAQYQASWNMVSENKKNEILRTSRMYDFTKNGVLESFWANVDFSENKDEVIKESKNLISDYHSSIVAQMNRLRK